MAGLLSNVFDGGDTGSQQGDASLAAEVEQVLDIEQEITISHTETVSWQSADGTTHSFTNSQDVTLTVGLDATLGAAADLTGAGEDASYG